jgi:DNA-binding CsgD family transcriptional regulator
MTTAPDPRITTVERWYSAYDARDLDALCSLADPEIEVVPASPLLSGLPGTSFHGHAGIRTLMKWSYDNYPGVRVTSTLARRVPAGVLAQTTYAFDPQDPADAKTSTHSVFRLQRGRIHRVHVFARESDALALSPEKGVLTAREREILQLLVRGLTAPQIADGLFVSPATVRTHVQNAMTRLGARTRIQAVSLALKSGEIEL